MSNTQNDKFSLFFRACIVWVCVIPIFATIFPLFQTVADVPAVYQNLTAQIAFWTYLTGGRLTLLFGTILSILRPSPRLLILQGAVLTETSINFIYLGLNTQIIWATHSNFAMAAWAASKIGLSLVLLAGLLSTDPKDNTLGQTPKIISLTMLVSLLLTVCILQYIKLPIFQSIFTVTILFNSWKLAFVPIVLSAIGLVVWYQKRRASQPNVFRQSIGLSFIPILASCTYLIADSMGKPQLPTASVILGCLPIYIYLAAILLEFIHQAKVTQAESKSSSKNKSLLSELTTTKHQNDSILEFVLNGIEEGVVIADMSAKFTHWNQAATKILGIGSSTVSPENWSELYGLFESDGITLCPHEKLPLVRALNGESNHNTILYLQNYAQKEGRFLTCNGDPIIDINGNQIGAIVIFRSIHRNDMSGTHPNPSSLQGLVSTQKIQLQKVQKELSDLISATQSTIRTPLQNILTDTQTFAENHLQPNDSNGNQLLSRLVSNSSSLNSMLSDLAQYHKLFQYPINPITMDVTPTLGKVSQKLTTELKDKNAKLQLPNTSPKIFADAAKLEIVLEHLLDNAIKFSGDNSPKIEVSFKQTDSHTEILVKDNGQGIPKSQLNNIFDMFYQVSPQNTLGNGMGLTIVKKIIDEHNGFIQIDSQETKGTTVSISFPNNTESFSAAHITQPENIQHD